MVLLNQVWLCPKDRLHLDTNFPNKNVSIKVVNIIETIMGYLRVFLWRRLKGLLFLTSTFA